MKKYLIIWAVVWVFIYVVVSGTGYPDAGTGVVGGALISLFFMNKILGSSWSGEVVEIKTERETYSDDHQVKTREIDYAYIKLTNGKTKKTQDLGWKVGDKLEKKNGQLQPKIIL